MSYKVNAVVTDKFPTENITDRFSKRVIWIKTDEQYPQVWEVQFANQNIDLLDNIEVNDRVEIQFDREKRAIKMETSEFSIRLMVLVLENFNVDLQRIRHSYRN